MTVILTRQGSFAIVTIDHPPVNALSRAVREALLDAANTLDAERHIQGVILLCKGSTFIAGADISEFGKEPEPPYLPEVIARIENASKPWIAAIHGSALGGGLEVAMGCRFRVASADASLGLPEVKLGIVPGAGGTVRLPRLAGVAAAVDMITTGAAVSATKAASMGLVDAVVEGDLGAQAIAFAQIALGNPLPVPIPQRPRPATQPEFWEAAKKDVTARAKGEIAPLKALECLQNACSMDFDAAMAFERKTFLELRESKQASALRHVFFAERAASRPPELSGIQGRDIRTAAVLGGGTMGAGIVAALREAGIRVTLVERDAAAVQRGLSNVAAIVNGLLSRGRMSATEAGERLAGIHGTEDYGMLADADLVIEAVFEDIAVKQAVFSKLSEVCRADAVLATNTSYLNPELIFAGLPHPQRFLGLHFFSPAHVMKLVEVVPTKQTAPEVLATGFGLARRLGKIPVRAGICDGFIGNRLLKITRAQAERVLLSGATPSQVDSAMRVFGLPMGPFEAQDLGGLDIAAFQRKAARERGETPFAPIGERLCALGRIGQKAGAGWYDYPNGSRKPVPSDTVAGILSEAALSSARIEWDGPSIVDAIVLPMVNEGANILEEQVALRAADIDLVKIYGYGFPRWRGGPMHYATARGLPEIVDILERLASRGLCAPPSEALRSGCWLRDA
ncbi:MAG: 3-hydroxyacyl-CoA dehydrogenase NAD-binding domain-containing protein [Polyangiaceae bacterium]|nr:3-hydroxyacyl-CoA dehydrogenase NAD-binding domain-containing protein [Polyangiaceae bacterium]